jgi:hypothetical protein
LAAFILAGAAAVAPSPAQAEPADPGSATALKVLTGTTEQIRALAVKGGGQLITLGAPASGDRAGTTDMKIQVTCYLDIGLPYGGGAYDADILVSGYVICDDYIHLGVLTVELFRGVDRVANTTAAYPYVYGIFATAGVTTCNEGVYFGIVGATVARYDLNPPSVTATYRGLPRYVGCASPPIPPPAFAVNNPGNQTTYIYESDLVQVTATGGTPAYTWSAGGLPAGLSMNSSTGVISGTVTTFGSSTVTVTAVDAAGRSASTQFRWTVAREPCPTC